MAGRPDGRRRWRVLGAVLGAASVGVAAVAWLGLGGAVSAPAVDPPPVGAPSRASTVVPAPAGPDAVACAKAGLLLRRPPPGCVPLPEAAGGEWPGPQAFQQAIVRRIIAPEHARRPLDLATLGLVLGALPDADWTPGPVTAPWVDALAADAEVRAHYGVAPVPLAPVVTGPPTPGGDDLSACVLATYAHDWPTAAPLCSRLAFAGDPHANLAAALIWLQADPPRHAEARDHARVAAEAGIRSAQILYGGQLLAGVGGPRDPARGVAWLRAAAAQGLPEALAAALAALAGPDTAPATEAALPSPLDDVLEEALRARAAGREDAIQALPLLPLHRLVLDALWAQPAVRERLRREMAAAEPAGS